MGIQESFDGPNGAKSWVKELQRRGDPDVVICLAGNKCDLEDKRAVTAEVSLVVLVMIGRRFAHGSLCVPRTGGARVR